MGPLPLLLPLLLATKPLPPTEPTLEMLADKGVMEVKLEGTPQTDHPMEKPCVYFDWGWAEKQGKSVGSRWRGGQSEAPLTVITPHGRLRVAVHSIRTFLAPSFSRTFTPSDAATAPAILRTQLEEGLTVILEDYCLLSGRTYWAAVRMDTVNLPPLERGEQPVPRRNAVLLISDKPFKGTEPRQPLTPGFQGWTY